MNKRIELEADGVFAVARLLEEAAPKSTLRLWEALPIEEPMRHVRWGGNCAYILSPALRDPEFPFESRISFYDRGTISLKPQHGEIALSYGQAQARDPRGTGWATPLAIFEGDFEPFLGVLARTQREGVKPLTIRRKED
jgi:hypothetical protein